jgi:hypothetical protein
LNQSKAPTSLWRTERLWEPTKTGAGFVLVLAGKGSRVTNGGVGKGAGSNISVVATLFYMSHSSSALLDGNRDIRVIKPSQTTHIPNDAYMIGWLVYTSKPDVRQRSVSSIILGSKITWEHVLYILQP